MSKSAAKLSDIIGYLVLMFLFGVLHFPPVQTLAVWCVISAGFFVWHISRGE